jgi:hypothetical protein
VFGYWDTHFGLLIGFINHIQVVTTVNYNIVTDLHNLHSLHASLFSLSAIVFITHSLDHTLQIKPSVRTVSLHMTNFPWLSLKHLNSLKYTAEYSNPFLSLSLMLWLTVSWPVCLGIKHPSGAYDQIFISVRNTEYVWQLRSWFRGAPSLTRGRVCLLYVPLALPAQSFSGPSPLGLEPVFYCLKFETSLFVASYDSQGHGGGIRPRLHTGTIRSCF